MKKTYTLIITFYLLVTLFSSGAKGQKVTSLTLINATTDTDIEELSDGYEINLTTQGSALNVRANTSGTIGSVRFILDGQIFRTESLVPYALAGDDINNGDYFVWTPSLGNHTLKAVPYTDAGATGTEGTFKEITFSVVETMDEITFPTDLGTGEVTIAGEMKKWHKVTLSFDGPIYNETDISPNPFLDFNLEVTFTNGSTTYTVPGYFATDGGAGESGAAEGNVWRVHFAPDQTGTWNYKASFKIGRNIAIATDQSDGDAITSIDGKTGSFTIEASDKSGRDFRSKGRLKYVGERYLQFSDTEEYFIKGGPDAPENLLAYEDFDNTTNEGNRRKSWSAHAADWQTGDPSWKGGKGTEIIGAINYLAEEGLNAFSFLTMNIGGDDKNVFPYVSKSDFKHFDCSKLDQWEILFEHADQLGLYLHFKTQETENDQLLDGGRLGVTRKLYYRELIARFSHHLALNWNLGEENTQTVQERKDMAQYISTEDPYKNHIVIHSFPDQQDQVYPTLLGTKSKLTGASVQTSWNKVHESTLKWVERSEASGVKWVVANDEQGNANIGVPDDSYTGSPSLGAIRQQTLWGNLMAGGAGVEYYFGYDLPHSDLTCQDYRSRDKSWDYVKIAIDFFSGLPLTKLSANDKLTSKGWCLANEGRTYLIYLNNGGTADVTFAIEGNYQVKWFNPRAGGDLQDGSVTGITGAGTHSIGNPPSDTSKDWAALITRISVDGNADPVASFTADLVTGTAPLKVMFDASGTTDSDGAISTYKWDFKDGITGEGKTTSHTFETARKFDVELIVTDDKGGFDKFSMIIDVKASSGDCGSQLDIKSIDFDHANSAFYVDNFTGTQILAIVPDEATGKPVSAEVSTTFDGESCNYDIIFHGVGESDGQAKFKILVNEQEIGEYTLPLSTSDWEVGTAFNKTFPDVAITNGDKVTVVGTTASADGKEWSRARWSKVSFSPAACEDTGIFEESDGYVIIEAESALELGTGWEITNSFSVDALGDGHLEFTGANSLGSVPQNSITEYQIKINTPGTYQFKWRSRNGAGAVKFDEENDSWLNIEAGEFYGTKGGEKHTFGSSDFIKVWIQDLNKWSWNSQGEHSGVNGMAVFATFNSPGVYTIKVAGRSHGHPIDRMALYQSDRSAIAMNSNSPESSSGCGSESSLIWATEKEYKATLVEEPLKIDGTIDPDWEFVELASGEFESTGALPPSTSDLSYDFRLAYDTEFVYLLAEVKDDTKKAYTGTASDYENWDNIELYFNPDNLHNDLGAYGSDALQIRMNYGLTDNTFSGAGNWKGDSDHTGFEYQSKDVSGGYILEARIPWSGILPGSISPDADLIMGFEVQVNDRDGSSIENNLSWANNTTTNKADTDTRKFGSILLKPKEFKYQDKTGWEVIFADSEDAPGGAKEMAIDGDVNTFWHTEWRENQPVLPHEIQIDFKKQLSVAEVHYLHRQDKWGPNGAIGKYEIYVSNDPANWGDAAIEGELDWPADLAKNYKELKIIRLNEAVSGRYLRLVALSETQNKPNIPFTAIAELDVVSIATETETVTGLDDLQNRIALYPNPTNGNDMILSLPAGNVNMISITNMQGKEVFHKKENTSEILIPTSKFQSGLYTLRVSSDKEVVYRKILVSN